jgi:acetolactate decarboxylase
MKKENSLYISSPVNALVKGILREDKTLKDILKHGNFGLGTFNDLDGEMVLLDSIFYQLHSDGTVSIPEISLQSPYACATFFHQSTGSDIADSLNFQQIQHFIDQIIPSKNLIFALKISGNFKSVKARSVPKQDSYRPLVDAAHDQKEFTFTGSTGVMVGFWTPDFLHSVSVPGYHLHYLTSDFAHGGHVLDCETESITIQIQGIDSLNLDLPHSLEYIGASLDEDTSEALKKAEH